MIIENERVAIFTYTLFENNTEGKVIEDVTKESPMNVVFGQGKLIPHFEEQLMGMTAGEKFEIKVPSEKAFGDKNPAALYDIPKETFKVDGVIDQSLFAIGNKIPMRDRSGNVLEGYVQSSDEENVKLDFNHPLAGTDIVFKGEIMEVREATYDELNPPQHGGCGCGSGGDGGGSCSTEGSSDDDHECCGSGSCSTEDEGHGHGGGHGHHQEEGHSCGCH